MEERFFISPLNLTAKISMNVLEGEFLEISGKRYIELSRKPRGKSIIMTLQNLNEDTRMIIYK